MTGLAAQRTAGGVRFPVLVKPRASRQEVAGLREGALCLRLTAPPVEGEANLACRQFLAGLLGVAPSRVSIVGGRSSRHKLIQVDGLSPEELLIALNSVLNGAR